MLPHDARNTVQRWLAERELADSHADDLLVLTQSLVAASLDMTQMPLEMGDTAPPPSEPPREPPTPSGSGGAPGPGEPPIRDFDALYEDLGVIGRGGMGEVHRVRDRLLQRVMVAKVLREDRLAVGDARARFLEEAQITAQLQHANIVPVHELAQGPDRRPWFTMKEVRGRTLKALIAAVHEASGEGGWRPTEDGWSFRRLVDDFRRACEAVAYAHGRGVMHRDLKPSNVMVSAYGEVLVVDWGLAKVGWGLGSAPPERDDDGEGLISTRRSGSRDIDETTVGTVAGTLAYMPPEQALGDLERIGPRSDVYSLGAILYELLSGSPPYTGAGWNAMWRNVVRGPPPALAGRDGAQRMPRALVEICERAMAREPEDRFPSVQVLLGELSAWIEGARKRDEARRIVAEAQAMLPDIEAKRAEVAVLVAEAEALAQEVPQYGDRAPRLPLWALEDRAEQLRGELEETEFERERILRDAFAHVPDFEPAHQALADQLRARHEAAERERDKAKASRIERALRLHDRGVHAEYLRGVGLLSLRTDPAGAIVDLYGFVEQERQLVPRYARTLGQTPLEAVELPIGSYLLRLRHDDRELATYPVLIEREGHWRSHLDESSAVPLLPKGSLGPDEVYVPEGRVWIGSHIGTWRSFPPHWSWVEGFVIGRFPVTNAEYIAYMEDLVAQGRVEEAIAASPPRSVGDGSSASDRMFTVRPDGRVEVQPDEDGDLWDLGWPVFRVTYDQAAAYAAWRAARDGLPWRLPDELEREKAARGVDGRNFPWGDRQDASFAVAQRFGQGRPMPLPARDPRHASDVSVYGVRGVSGNSGDWCRGVAITEPALDWSDPQRPKIVGTVSPALRPVRGGLFMGVSHNAGCVHRIFVEANIARDGLGFRLVRKI